MIARAGLIVAVCSLIAFVGCGAPPPATPAAPTGAESGSPGISYEFNAVTSDPLGLFLQYRFSWGDGQTSAWGPLLPSGTAFAAPHSWQSNGTYEVRAQARNMSGRESEFSLAHPVTIGQQSGYPDSVIARIPVGYSPFGMCMLPNSQYLYVANRIGGISVISTATKTVVHTVATPSGEPCFMAPTPDGQHVYFAVGSNQVGVLRTSDNVVTAMITVQDGPRGIAVDPSGSFAYAANYYSHTVSVIRTSDNTVVANVPIPGSPWCVEVTPDGEYVYASGRDTDIMSVIRTSDNTVAASIVVGREPGDIAFSPGGEYAYTSCRLDNYVAVIRTSDMAVVAHIPGCDHPTGISLLPGGAYIYLSNYYGDYVLVARASDNTIVDTLQFGTVTDFSAVDAGRNEVYIGCPDEDEIWVVGRGAKHYGNDLAARSSY